MEGASWMEQVGWSNLTPDFADNADAERAVVSSKLPVGSIKSKGT